MNQKIKLQALAMAIGSFLSEMPTDRHEELLEQMSDDNRQLFDEMGLSVWQPFEDESLSAVATRISESAD